MQYGSVFRFLTPPHRIGMLGANAWKYTALLLFVCVWYQKIEIGSSVTIVHPDELSVAPRIAQQTSLTDESERSENNKVNPQIGAQTRLIRTETKQRDVQADHLEVDRMVSSAPNNTGDGDRMVSSARNNTGDGKDEIPALMKAASEEYSKRWKKIISRPASDSRVEELKKLSLKFKKISDKMKNQVGFLEKQWDVDIQVPNVPNSTEDAGTALDSLLNSYENWVGTREKTKDAQKALQAWRKKQSTWNTRKKTLEDLDTMRLEVTNIRRKMQDDIREFEKKAKSS